MFNKLIHTVYSLLFIHDSIEMCMQKLSSEMIHKQKLNNLCNFVAHVEML